MLATAFLISCHSLRALDRPHRYCASIETNRNFQNVVALRVEIGLFMRRAALGDQQSRSPTALINGRQATASSICWTRFRPKKKIARKHDLYTREGKKNNDKLFTTFAKISIKTYSSSEWDRQSTTACSVLLSSIAPAFRPCRGRGGPSLVWLDCKLAIELATPSHGTQ